MNYYSSDGVKFNVVTSMSTHGATIRQLYGRINDCLGKNAQNERVYRVQAEGKLFNIIEDKLTLCSRDLPLINDANSIREYLIENPSHFDQNVYSFRDKIIDPGIKILQKGDLMLTDLVPRRQIWLVKITGRKWKTPNLKRTTFLQPKICVISNINKTFGQVFSGSWVVPK